MSSHSIKAPPALSKSNSYETWLKEMEIWKIYTDTPVEKRTEESSWQEAHGQLKSEENLRYTSQQNDTSARVFLYKELGCLATRVKKFTKK